MTRRLRSKGAEPGRGHPGMRRNLVASAVASALDRVPASVAARIRPTSAAARLLRPFVRRLVPAGITPVVVRSGGAKGLRLLINAKDEKYYWTGAIEEGVQNALADVLRPGDVFWDVGAHIGFFTMQAARLVGEDGQVHAFEPLAANRARLEGGIELNGFGNVTIHATAVAELGGERMLYESSGTTMWSLVAPEGGAGVVVPAATLDDLARTLPRPRVIKIDVEGAEVDVLRGGIRLLAGRHADIVVEFSSDELLTEARRLLPTPRSGRSPNATG